MSVSDGAVRDTLEEMTMRMTIARVALGVALLGMMAVPLSAHHSFAAEFDATKPITLTGTITKIERISPHGWIHIDVKGTDGKVENWAIETGAPAALARRGLGRSALPIGTEIIVHGYRAKDGSTTANGNTITFTDGRNISLGSSIEGATPPPAANPK
jgi:hypothetical protein